MNGSGEAVDQIRAAFDERRIGLPWVRLAAGDALARAVTRSGVPLAVRHLEEVLCVESASGRVVVVHALDPGCVLERYPNPEAFIRQAAADLADERQAEFPSLVAQADTGARRGIGFDIGGVILAAMTDGAPLTARAAHSVPEVAGAVATLRWCNRVGEYPGGVHLVSRVSPSTERWTLGVLEEHEVFERTGIPRANVHFCRRARDKATIASDLALSHFVDDRVDVLAAMDSTVENRFLFAEHLDEPGPTPPGVVRVDSMIEFRLRVGIPVPDRFVADWRGPTTDVR